MNEGTTDLVVYGNEPLLDMLVQIKAVGHQDLHLAERSAAQTGRQVPDQLLHEKLISQGDLIEASVLTGKSVRVSKLTDLPDWNVVLNDAGQLMGGVMRNESVAVLAFSADRKRRCFLVIDEFVGRVDAASAVARALAADYPVAATIVAEGDLLQSIYAKWDQQNATTSEVDEGDTSDVQKSLHELADQAFRRGASDIHITSSRGRADIHLRIHGELEHMRPLKPSEASAIVSAAYNTMTEAGSTKTGFNPKHMQDGVIELALPEGQIRLRYSGLPLAPDGFDVTLRVIPIGIAARRKEMHELGYSQEQCDALERIFSHASGMILFAGTTGSGKSTTMANLLRKIAEERPGKKIRTVEEPVEYRIEGVAQTPVVRLKGDNSDFLVALRQIMRSDPDIIGVGEIRDADTAALAIQAVRSGHLCVSTIHADGAQVCYDRLIGMGINRLDLCQVGLVAGLVYQKLLPILCECKLTAQEFSARDGSPRTKAMLGRLMRANLEFAEEVRFRNPNGCPNCEGRGVVGRTVCAEILRPTPAMLAAIASGDSAKLISLWRATIDHENFFSTRGKTAFEHALIKMQMGLVSPDAVEDQFCFLDEPIFEGVH